MLRATRLCLLLGGALPLAGAASSQGFQGVVAERHVRVRTADLAGEVKPEDAPSIPPGNKIRATSGRGLPSPACVLQSRPNSFGLLLSRRNAADCDCIDRSDMKLKIEEAQLAIRVLSDQAQNLEGQRFTGEGKDALDAKLQDRLNENLHGRLPTEASGSTSPMCVTTNNARTACMRASTERHEAVHRAACLSRGVRVLSGSFTMADYAREDIKAFNASLQFLKGELASLGYKCKKGTCRGTCTYVDPPTVLERKAVGFARCKDGEWHKVPSTPAECAAIRRRNEATDEKVIPICGPYTGFNGDFKADAKTREDVRACTCEMITADGIPPEPEVSQWCQGEQP